MEVARAQQGRRRLRGVFLHLARGLRGTVHQMDTADSTEIRLSGHQRSAGEGRQGLVEHAGEATGGPGPPGPEA
eukprot:3980928-Alexandrium_andersonii.AAC.1